MKSKKEWGRVPERNRLERYDNWIHVRSQMGCFYYKGHDWNETLKVLWVKGTQVFFALFFSVSLKLFQSKISILKIKVFFVFLSKHFFFRNNFIEVKLIYKKVHIFSICNLMSLDIHIHPWNHYQNRGSKHTQDLQKFHRTFTCVLGVLNRRSMHSAHF